MKIATYNVNSIRRRLPLVIAWLKEHTAGSGAYMIESFKPGEQVIMKRNEAWNRGTAEKAAFFKRLIIQTVPELSLVTVIPM